MREVWFYTIANEYPCPEYGPFESKRAAEGEWQSKLNDKNHYVNSKWWQREYGPPKVEFIEKSGTAEVVVTLIQSLSKDEQWRIRKGMGWCGGEPSIYGETGGPG